MHAHRHGSANQNLDSSALTIGVGRHSGTSWQKSHQLSGRKSRGEIAPPTAKSGGGGKVVTERKNLRSEPDGGAFGIESAGPNQQLLEFLDAADRHRGGAAVLDDRPAGVMNDQATRAVALDFRQIPTHQIRTGSKEMQHAQAWRNLHADR
ncbi:MAG TPA: hypothetical protein VM165_02925 [Planctomycetaceae bacterium]|nr:hypothetical protein [Planctomycetaceae bacterium]